MTDIIIVGAGTAGMTACLYALRNGKSVTIIESTGFGGQIANSPRVENFPSIKSISGIEFSDNLFEQISSLGANVEFDEVQKVEKVGDTFNVYLPNKTLQAKAVILATGVKHKHLNLANEEKLVGKGVSYCAVCDGPFYKGQNVALIGDGNSALQYGILLSGYCAQVFICTWTDKFFGDKKLVETLLSKPNVKHIANVSASAFVGESELVGLELTSTKTGEKQILNCNAVFVAIGQEPKNARFANLAELDEKSYFLADEKCATKTAGVFVAGDCRTKAVRQLTTAVSDGAISALSACHYIDNI